MVCTCLAGWWSVAAMAVGSTTDDGGDGWSTNEDGAAGTDGDGWSTNDVAPGVAE